MILLFGGTAETSATATKLAQAGYHVLVSTATDTQLDIGQHPWIERTTGRLGPIEMVRLAKKKKTQVVVDAGHPYAEQLHKNAQIISSQLGLPLFRLQRKVTHFPQNAIRAANHKQAAKLAFDYGRTVLLTTGSRNLIPYVLASRRRQVQLVARILDHPSSIGAAKAAGLDAHLMVTGRGPFGFRDNLALLRKFDVGAMVTKDGGQPSGVIAKIEAALVHGCSLVVIDRPAEDNDCFFSVDQLVSAILTDLSQKSHFCP